MYDRMSISYPVPGQDSSSKLLAIVLVALIGAAFVPRGWIAHPQAGGGPPQESVGQAGTQPDFRMQIEPNQFLMKNGTSANPDVVFTPLNGFIGSVNLSATISPLELSGPIVSFNPSTFKLNASLQGSPADPMIVNTSNRTESGVYTITVIGSSAWATHSATATVGVTSFFVSGGAELVYKGHFSEVAYVGGSTVLNSTFLDLGYVPIGITALTVSFSFGTFQVNQSCTTSGTYPTGTICISPYVYVNPYEQKTTALTIQIPGNARPGNYTVVATVKWELSPLSIYQKLAPDLTTHGYLMVYSNPSAPSPTTQPPSKSGPPPVLGIPFANDFSKVIIPALGGWAAIVLILVGLVIRGERKNRSAFQHLSGVNRLCTRCGSPVLSAAAFCIHCGNPILPIG
jgi:hypothetical protein